MTGDAQSRDSQRRRLKLLVATVATSIALAAVATSQAAADFGIAAADGGAFDRNGGAYTQAGGHPYSASTTFSLNSHVDANFHITPDGGGAKTIIADVPPGLLGNTTVAPTCLPAELIKDVSNWGCPPDTQVGTVTVLFDLGAPIGIPLGPLPLYNMKPAKGVAAAFAFKIFNAVVFLHARLRDDDYGVTFEVPNISEAARIIGSNITLWGVPADDSHDAERYCPGDESFGCPSFAPLVPFVRNPTSCPPSGVGLITTFRTEAWDNQGVFEQASFETHEPPGFDFVEFLPPSEWGPPIGTTNCGLVPSDPDISIQPTTDHAESPTGLNVKLTLPTDGLLNADGIGQADLKRVVVRLPEGMTVNPSVSEGVGVCAPADFGRETADSLPGAGCPSTSKIGTVEVESPLLAEKLNGSLYLAKQDDPGTTSQGAENPFDSLLALYIVVRNPERGIIVKLAGQVTPDPDTGQLITTFDDNPQLPFSTFTLKFREGQRSPLVSPPVCGTYSSEASFVPWSAADPENPTPAEIVHDSSSFQITQGPGGAPCPQGGTPPFKPGFSAGSINNNAGSFTPFTMRLTREDGEQDMTRFSSILPPGVLGKLAGVVKCSDQAIASAKTKTGREEIASPSCPANSQIGRILAGAGVGSVLTYVPGKVYLGGPVGGDPLSVVVITPAVAGPFDVGTVITREALTLNPETAEVEVDGKASDPIPHILAGIPLKLRDLRVYVDRENFILNPTNCDPSEVKATLFGSYLDVLNPIDDRPVDLVSRFQAANCANLGFRPKLSVNLKGGTKRGGHPALKAVLNARPGDANIGAATVTLPRSAFLDQAHIRTICTRVQFAARACPSASVYGHATAFTPLLDEPVEGPVYLRSSNHKLPDLVAALHGLVDVNVVGRIDSFKGGIRSSFETVPDAPVSKFILSMQGGKKGLVVNSRNLCVGKNKADARFVGQNGKPYNFRPVVKPDCAKGRKGKHK